MSVACRCPRPPYDAAGNATRGVRSEANGNVTYDVLGALRLVEGLHPIEPDEQVVHEGARREQVLYRQPRGNEVLG